MGAMKDRLIELEIPTSAAVVSPLLGVPYFNQKRFDNLVAALKGGGAVPPPVVRTENGVEFEVIKGWDVVSAVIACGQERVRALVVELGDCEALKYSLVEHGNDTNMGWVDFAENLLRVKQLIKIGGKPISDKLLADAVGMSRTTVTRRISIIRTAPEDLKRSARAGRITYSTMRRLVTLDKNLLDSILSRARRFKWNEQRMLIEAFPSSEVECKEEPNKIPKEKSVDVRRLEVELSERIKFPTEISDSGVGKGSIDISGFSLKDIVAIAEGVGKLGGVGAGAKLNCTVSLPFSSFDEFDRIVGLVEES